MEQVLSISGRTGTIGRFNGKDADVPFLNASFWGPTTLGAGIIVMPVLIQPIQGKNQRVWTIFFSLEYTFKVADPLRLAIFYDGGYLSGRFKFLPGDSFEGWYDNWGIGLRIMVMNATRLDLGFPITDPSILAALLNFTSLVDQDFEIQPLC